MIVKRSRFNNLTESEKLHKTGTTKCTRANGRLRTMHIKWPDQSKACMLV